MLADFQPTPSRDAQQVLRSLNPTENAPPTCSNAVDHLPDLNQPRSAVLLLVKRSRDLHAIDAIVERPRPAKRLHQLNVGRGAAQTLANAGALGARLPLRSCLGVCVFIAAPARLK